jgi:hypothetical protein
MKTIWVVPTPSLKRIVLRLVFAVEYVNHLLGTMDNPAAAVRAL